MRALPTRVAAPIAPGARAGRADHRAGDGDSKDRHLGKRHSQKYGRPARSEVQAGSHPVFRSWCRKYSESHPEHEAREMLEWDTHRGRPDRSRNDPSPVHSAPTQGLSKSHRGASGTRAGYRSRGCSSPPNQCRRVRQKPVPEQDPYPHSNASPPVDQPSLGGHCPTFANDPEEHRGSRRPRHNSQRIPSVHPHRVTPRRTRAGRRQDPPRRYF